jgi:hypothetical protein
MLSGLPGALIYGKNVYHGTDGNYIKLPGIRPIPPRPPTAPDLSKAVCPPGMYRDNIRRLASMHGMGINEFLVEILTQKMAKEISENPMILRRIPYY